LLKAQQRRRGLNRINPAKAKTHKGRMKDRAASTDVPLEKMNSVEEKQTIKKATLFLIIRNEWGNRVKEVSQK
jgi:hypothetical protein